MAAKRNSKGDTVGWRIPKMLRKRINIKALGRNQTAEQFVIECMEANTEDIKPMQERLASEKRSGKKPIVVR